MNHKFINLKVFVLLLLTLPINLFAQNGDSKKISTKFNRPTIVNLFVENNGQFESSIINTFQNLRPVDKVDQFKIDGSKITGSMGEAVAYVSKDILAKWFNRDTNGDFNFLLINQRGVNSATDADVIAAKNSLANRLGTSGRSLIDKTYFIVYDIKAVLTMNEVYDQMDENGRRSAAITKKAYTPVERTQEGYQAQVEVTIYKLNFDDAAFADFNDKYWSEAGEDHSAAKIAAWDRAKFPVTYIRKLPLIISTSSQAKKETQYYKKRPMADLLADLPSLIQEKAITSISSEVEDFRVKASIFQEKPLLVKIGLKEGVYVDERFFVYEVGLNNKGKQKKIRKGVVKATKHIANNRGNATGESTPSRFQQQGGKKLYQGMFLEEKEDKGLSLQFGYALSGDGTMGGISINGEINLSRVLGKVARKKGGHLRLPGGINFGIHFIENSFSNVNVGSVSTGYGNSLVSGYASGDAEVLEFSLSKDMYFTQKGNFYFIPSISYGFSQIGITNASYQTIESGDKDYTWTSSVFRLGFGLGINISPRFSIIINPYMNSKGAYTTGNKDKLSGYSYGSNPKWDFGKIGESSTSFSTILGLKIKF